MRLRALPPLVSWALALLVAPASAVTLDWVAVGNPGNAPDVPSTNCWAPDCGAVPYAYSISKYEITNAQYAEFLNAKAAADPLGLYNASMGSDVHGGITRSGSSGTYTYAPKAGFANKPVNFVSFYDALRFINWLDNGQGSADTETGSYTITPGGITNNTITRNPGAEIGMPTENEWYKAAYFDGAGYFEYPAGSDTEVACDVPTATANRANCEQAVDAATDVGAYTGSASPYGTFDQGGNLFEWNEQIVDSFRGLRGAGWGSGADQTAAAVTEILVPTSEFGVRVGFRVVHLVPEPGGMDLLAITVLVGMAARRGRGEFLDGRAATRRARRRSRGPAPGR